MFIAQASNGREDRVISQPSSAPSIPAPPDRSFLDWGLALAICYWVGNKLWGLFAAGQMADTKTQDLLIKFLMEQNKILLTAVVEKNVPDDPQNPRE